MSKRPPLSPDEAKESFAARLSGIVDRARSIPTKLGFRPYRVFLVWSRFTGEERGEGKEILYRRIEILPTPKVDSLDSLSLSPTAAGIVPLGSVRVSRITATLTERILSGKTIPTFLEVGACGCSVMTWAPDKVWQHLPANHAFWWEVVEDGRGDPDPTIAKFRLASPPNRRASKVDWIVTLERISEDRDPQTGASQLGDDDD